VLEDKNQYRFSSALKTNSIFLDEKRAQGKQTESGKHQLALIEEGMGAKYGRIKFRVGAIKGNIMLGACLKNIVTAKNYIWDGTAGHGFFCMETRWLYFFPQLFKRE